MPPFAIAIVVPFHTPEVIVPTPVKLEAVIPDPSVVEFNTLVPLM